ncbi:MAG TPA: dipeptidase [Thermoanaerobaculia bacterium]|nr:dipeptidase [Thermoanaerobaculia bacterium]
MTSRLITIAALATLSLSAHVFAAETADDPLIVRARKILAKVPIIDGHNDVPWEMRERVGLEISKIDLRNDTSLLTPAMHTDIPRLRKGGVGAQFWSVYVPADRDGPVAFRMVAEQIDIVQRMTELYPETFENAVSVADIARIGKKKKIASLIGIEGGHAIDNSLPALRQLYMLGARYMTLTHSKNNDWADSATDAPRHNGLTAFGKDVIGEMNRLGMLVDLSHVSAKTMHDVLDVTRAPVIFSHSSARAVVNHPRDVPDDILKRLVVNNGVVMITFVPGFISEKVRLHGAEQDAEEARLKTLNQGDPQRVAQELAAWKERHPAPKASVSDVADHVDHIRKIAGVDRIGLGGDFDGIKSTIPGLDSVDDYPSLFAELLRRGYSETDLEKIAGRNLLRVFTKAEAVAAKLRSQGRSSEAKYVAVATQ